jgi:hypothetical protein
VKWMRMYQKLVAYKNQHKSTNVPRHYKIDRALGNWVKKQRVNYKKNELFEERIKHLESIGFVWDALDAQWMEMYHRLVAYKKEYKHTFVPQKYKADPKLGVWVNAQKAAYSNGKARLSEKRLKLLNSIDFDWSAQR